MAQLATIGRIFVAVGLIGLGVEHFVLRAFVTGRAPAWPEAVAGGTLWAYLSGAVFVLTGLAILSGRWARLAAALAAALVFSWAVLRHVPVLLAAPALSGAWTQGGKAVTWVAGLLAVSATFPPLDDGRSRPWLALANLGREAFVLAKLCLGLFFVLTGIQHFLYVDFVASLIPGWFPGDAVAWTYFAGVALLCGGLGLFVPRTARPAALLSGLMVFSWFWIVHVPRTFLAVSDGIAVFEALAFSGLAFVLAGHPFPTPEEHRS